MSKATTYRLQLDDKKRVEISARSAAEAIEEALRKHQGRRVIECYSGLKQRDVDFLRSVDRDACPMLGWVTHDIPEGHKAVGVGTTFPKATRRLDNTAHMFDEEKIKSESARALSVMKSTALK